uniref:Transposase IS66 n=1 Tax=Solibacter usitatus (strain Ellin6076) TaxID=234267 RepID=Q01TS6_SOLUE
MAADSKITLEVLRGYLNCPYLAHLLLAGKAGVKSDYEIVISELEQEVRLNVVARLRSQHTDQDLVTGVSLDAAALSNGTAYVLNAELQRDGFSIHFDGLKRVAGRSRLGNFQYVPLLFCGTNHIHKTQRHLLEALGLLLSRVQGVAPSFGIIYHGSHCAATKVRLPLGLPAANERFDEVTQIQRGDTLPKLLLNPHCPACQFRQHCHSAAVEQDSISLLGGLKQKELKRFARKGLFTLTQLAHTFRPRRKGKRSDRRSNHRYHALQALAIRDKRVYVLGAPDLISRDVQIYLDVESNPDEGFVYLVGMIVRDGSGETRHSFWADTKDQEREIFDQLVAVVSRYEKPAVFCYGGYERSFIQRMRRLAKRKRPIDKLLAALVNTLSIIYTHFYFPTYSNGLKEVAGWLAFRWSDPDASGLQSIAWRIRWERTHDGLSKAKLVEYNLEDCAALRTVTEFVKSACGSASAPTESGKADALPPMVMRVQDLDKLANNRTWGKIAFVHDDFEYVNNCAYFDYQRQRVFFRADKKRRRRIRKPGVHLNRRIRPTKRIEIKASKCPFCGGRNLVSIPKGQRAKGVNVRVKRAFDLVITPGGMKRKIIECRATVYRCLGCDHRFASEQYQRLAKHFHSLMSWAMYEHVAHRLSAGTLQQMFRDLFGLTVSDLEILMFKSLMARFYRTTYKALLGKILSGPILHVDETYVKLRTGKGYVWVLSSTEEVVYLYQPTREADFLKKMVRNFRGVLVSDFYAAYDSIPCPQQKCLIHLMRDMNQDLLNNPFDQELQSITKPFGALLRSIVATIDKHGLKQRRLARHLDEVEEFFRELIAQSPRSDAARALRERLLKWQGKLFTFLRYDSVPWNNNNAENAIKQFAYYREGTTGTLKEAGLNEYLVLLSVFQTCRYRGISFLKFLLSRERDIDGFCEAKRKRRRRPEIELYPPGFTPNHLKRLGGHKNLPGSSDSALE